MIRLLPYSRLLSLFFFVTFFYSFYFLLFSYILSPSPEDELGFFYSFIQTKQLIHECCFCEHYASLATRLLSFTLQFFHQYLFFSLAAQLSNCDAPACSASALSSSSDSFMSLSKTLSTFTRMISTTCTEEWKRTKWCLFTFFMSAALTILSGLESKQVHGKSMFSVNWEIKKSFNSSSQPVVLFLVCCYHTE